MHRDRRLPDESGPARRGPEMNRSEIEDELLAWMASGEWAPDPQRFERIALELFRFQFEHCDPYARLCRSLQITPDQISCADEIPAVPTGAFKEFELRCFEAEDTLRSFRTSGTGNWVGTAMLAPPAQADSVIIISQPMYALTEYFIPAIVTCLTLAAYSNSDKPTKVPPLR